MMEGIERPQGTFPGSTNEINATGVEPLLQYRSFSVAPDISIKTAVLALTNDLLKDGLQSLVALQANVKRVIRILYEDGQSRQPYTSRTLAHVSFQLCNAVPRVNEDLTRKLCHTLVAEAFTGLRMAWIVSSPPLCDLQPLKHLS
jgi:hypothetical protein